MGAVVVLHNELKKPFICFLFCPFVLALPQRTMLTLLHGLVYQSHMSFALLMTFSKLIIHFQNMFPFLDVIIFW